MPFLVDPVSGASLPSGPMGIQCRVISDSSIDVFWGTPPLSTSTANLTMTRLVRSEVGPPAWEEDGDVLVDSPIGNLLRYTDEGLRPATYYYYTLFAFDATVQTWLRAGSCGTITPDQAFDMGERMYRAMPAFYRALDDEQQVAGPGPLQRFLSLLGFELDVVRTEIESLMWIWDSKRGSAQAVPYALGQFQLEPEPELGYGNQRQLLRAAIVLYALKGSALCVRTLCSTVTGWATQVASGANLLVDNLDAQFDGSTGRWLPTNATLGWHAGDVTVNAPNGTGVLVLTASNTSTPSASLYANDPVYTGVPVIPGQAYGISALIRGSAADAVTIAVQFWDSHGATVGPLITGSPATPDPSDWNKQVSVTVTAPAGAWSMSLRVATAGTVAGHVTYISSVMVQPLASPTTAYVPYQPARDIRITVQADQVNEVYNPKFATNTNSWNTTVGADVTASGAVLSRITSDKPPPVSSGSAGQLVTTGPSQGAWTACPEVAPEQYYTATMWVKLVSGTGVLMIVRDKATGVVHPTPLMSTIGVWTDLEVSLVTGEQSYEVDISLVPTSNGTVLFGAVMLTRGGPEVAYFDGDIASSTADYMWEGQANASRSHFYRQRTTRSYRFRELLPRFIIGGQTATLLFAQPPVISAVYPADDLYPSDSLFPGG